MIHSRFSRLPKPFRSTAIHYVSLAPLAHLVVVGAAVVLGEELHPLLRVARQHVAHLRALRGRGDTRLR